jgi:EAL domain-containing protein (putative c-di-GMP-specific phosphodiesterase class I)/GGDEF domain-containing protein
MMRSEKTKRQIKNEDFLKISIWQGGMWHALLVVVLILLSGLLVYYTGGIKYVYSHFMYIPIFLAAYFFDVPGGVIAGILGGLVLGPSMPMVVETGEMQTLYNWLYRLIIFTLVGGMQGAVFATVKRQVKELHWQASHNRYTGLPNRTHLYLDLEQKKENRSLDTVYAIFMIQVDNHARITRILDMEELNKLNMMVFHRLKNILGDSSVLYQILPYLLCLAVEIDDERNTCDFIAESIYAALREPFEINDVPVFVNISIGVAQDNLKNMSPHISLQNATVAAQVASEKELKYWIYEREEFQTARNSQALLGDVLQGIDRHEFKLNFQPIVRLQNGEVMGVEALLRWNHGKLGLIPPMSFLPALEHTSLLYSLHDWEICEIVAQLASWKNFDGYLGINLSTRVLLDHSWIERFESLLDTFDLYASRIIFEITETAIIKDVERSLSALKRLRAIGSRIALDDFGTGYSSLEYIQLLPVDYMKIDKSFVLGVHKEPKKQQIVHTALSLAASIEMQTIAEGIESQADFDWLLKAGCMYGQGFWIGKPMPGNKLESWIKANHPHSA